MANCLGKMEKKEMVERTLLGIVVQRMGRPVVDDYVKSRARLFLQFSIPPCEQLAEFHWDLSKYFKQEMVNVIITTQRL